MATISEWKGKPILCLNPLAKFGRMQFGLSKARLILANLDAIRDFVQVHGDLLGGDKGGNEHEL